MLRKWVVVLATLFLLFGAAEGKQRKQKSDDKQATSKASKPESTAKVDINTASQSDLESVKGIGPATAKKIIAARPYSSIDDLKKAGLTAGRIDSMRASLTVSNTSASPSSAATTKAATSKGSSNTSSTGSNNDSTKKPSLWERLKGKKSADTGSGAATSSSSSMAPANSSSTTSNSKSPSAMTAAPGGGNGKVWVNKDTKVFHREGDHWYGKTKNGEYMTEQEAVSAGYRPVKERKK